MRKPPLNIGWLYAVFTVVALLLYLCIRWLGAVFLEAPPRDQPFVPATGGGHSSLLALVMIALAAITLASRVLGLICERFLRQPPVIGEILAGILLGPSLLGLLAPSVSGMLFPAEVMPSLGIISKVGIVLFMFVVGLELDGRLLRNTSRATIAISHASIVLPFILGALLALFLYPRYGTGDIGFTAFSLFFGVSLSVTAFPVLARILREYRVNRTPFGATAMACAAIDDVTAWTLLALVIGIVTAHLDSMVFTIPALLFYFAVMFIVVRPAYQWLSRRMEKSSEPVSIGVLTTVFVGMLLSAAATDLIGIHALFGAFLFGVFLPHEGKLAEALRTRMEDLVGILFLPAFFAVTGLRTEIGLVGGGSDWLACGLIVLVATVGKIGGSYVAARYAGMRPNEATALGILMNTRGLMELIVLNIGLDLGVISPRLFAMMVIMALVTTFMTSPLFKFMLKRIDLNMALQRRQHRAPPHDTSGDDDPPDNAQAAAAVRV